MKERWLTPVDRELLEAVGRTGSVSTACRAIGIGRDRGVYRLRRLGKIAGGPVVRSLRGGRDRGRSRLTALGERLRRSPTGSLAGLPHAPGRFRGIFHARGGPHVAIPGGPRLRVAFDAAEGAPVELVVDPEAVLVALRRFSTSARNVFPARVTALLPGPGEAVKVRLRRGRLALAAAVTRRSVAELGLRPGRRVVVYLKATAIRPSGAPLSPVSPRRRPRTPPPPRGGSASR